MANLGLIRLGSHVDKETGCVGYGEEYQLCRQAFFTKQQNALLKNQQSSTAPKENITAIQTQIDALKGELNKIQTQQTSVQTPQGIILDGNLIILTLFIFVVAIVTTIFITKRIYTKKL